MGRSRNMRYPLQHSLVTEFPRTPLVGQRPRSVRISARVSAAADKARRGRSWGDYIETLARQTGAADIVATAVQQETLRCVIWAAATLDCIARRHCLRADPKGAVPAQVAQTAELICELAQLRCAIVSLPLRAEGGPEAGISRPTGDTVGVEQSNAAGRVGGTGS